MRISCSKQYSRREAICSNQASWLCASFIALAATLCSAAAPAAQNAKDVKGSRDHPMISRIEGSRIIGFDQKEFDEYVLVKGTVSGYRDAAGSRRDNLERALDGNNSLRLEGRVWKLTYGTPKNRSTLEIIRSYQNELTNAGFQVLFQCTNRDCSGPPPTAKLGTSVFLARWANC